MGNRKKMGKIEQQGQQNPSPRLLEGAVLAVETDPTTDVIDAVAAATAAGVSASITRKTAAAVAASSSLTAVEAATAASTRASVLETAEEATPIQAASSDVLDDLNNQARKGIHKENDDGQVGMLFKDVDIAVDDGSNISREASGGNLFIKTFCTEDKNKGDVVHTTDVNGDSVGTAHPDQHSLDVECQRQENEMGDSQALQQPQLQNAKQQQQMQHGNQQHHLHHPHPQQQQQKPNQNPHQQQQQQQLQQQHHPLSQFLHTTTNNTSTLSINRPQQQGLITLPAIPAPCYVHQQTSGSTVQTMGVDFIQQANQQQLFSITNPAHQVIGQIPSIHFPAIASNQHQQNIIVHPSHNTPGIQPQPTTVPSLPSAPFKNFEQQNLLCQGLNQHQQHQQNIMQQIEWQIQLQKNHIRQQQQQQQQQQQLQNLRQNLQQQQQQLIQLQNSGMFYQHQLKQRQNHQQQQQQHHQNNGHHNHPHQQQHHHSNMLQLRHHQFPSQNSKVDLLCSSLDAPIEKNNDVFRGNQKMHNAPQFHAQQQQEQQQPQHNQHSHLQLIQLQPPQQQKKKHKQEHQHAEQQPQLVNQSSSVSMFESQQTTTGGTDGTHSVNASRTTSTTTVIPATASSNTTTANQGVNLYVKHLDDDVDDSALKKMFSRFGEVVSAKVMMEGQMSRGFGFVCFARAEDAARATRDIRRKSDDMSSMKNLYVAPAQRKEERQAIFRERLRSFMEDTPPGTASQDHETKKFVKPTTIKERTSTLSSEAPPTQAISNSSEVSFDRPSGSHTVVLNGGNEISTNTFYHNSKTKNIPLLQNSDGKNPCAQLNQKENVRGMPFNNSFSQMPNNRFENVEPRQHRPIKNIFDLDNFSLEKLNMPLLQTAAQTCAKVQKNSMYSSTLSLGNAEESQAEPIPQWFYGADEEDGGFGNDVIALSQRDELLDNKLDSDCFVPTTAMDNLNNEHPRWLKMPDYFDFPDELNQDHDLYLCQADACPEVIEQIKAGNHEMVEVNNTDDIQLHTDPLQSWSGNLHIWNCKLITKEDNQILKENDVDEEEEGVGALLENKEDCIGTLDDCNRLVKACISCCTDTDSCISGDEDIDQEYKESNLMLDTKCNRSDYFRSSQNVQNNNSIIDDDASSPMSPLSKWTKSRKRCLSSDERIPAAAETRIYDMTNHLNTNTNAPTHCKIIVTSTTNMNKIRVLDLPVVVAPSRKDTKRNRKRKQTTTSLAGDVEDVASPKRIRTEENNERPVVRNNCKWPWLC